MEFNLNTIFIAQISNYSRLVSIKKNPSVNNQSLSLYLYLFIKIIIEYYFLLEYYFEVFAL